MSKTTPTEPDDDLLTFADGTVIDNGPINVPVTCGNCGEVLMEWHGETYVPPSHACPAGA